MRRIYSIFLVLACLLSGCVQADTTYLEDYGFVQTPQQSPTTQTEASPQQATQKPTLPPLKTPAAPQAPEKPSTPQPPATPAPPASPAATAAPTPDPTPQASTEPGKPAPATPTAPEAPVQNIPEPPAAGRLYFADQPGFAGEDAVQLENGKYALEDLTLLSKLLQLGQWQGLAKVFSLFGTTLSPDIRLADFAKDGLFAPSPIISGLGMDEDRGLAYFVIRQSGGNAQGNSYLFLFQKQEEAYVPLSAICMSSGEGEHEFVEVYGNLFFVQHAESTAGSETLTRSRWYLCADGQLKLDIVASGERRTETLLEQYASDISTVQWANTAYGFAGKLSGEVLLQYERFPGSPTSISLGTGGEYTLYYNEEEAAFYTDADRREFFLDTGAIQPGQYKHIFDAQLNQIKLIARTEYEVSWAEAFLGMPDWNASPQKAPVGEDAFTPAAGAELPVVSFAKNQNAMFAKNTLEVLADDIESMRGDGLMQLLASYGVQDAALHAKGPLEEEPFDLLWKGIREISCTVNIHSARERIAILDIRYRNGADNGLLLLFRLEGDAWAADSMYAYAPARGAEESAFELVGGALCCTYQTDSRNRQPVYETMVIQPGKPALRFASSYTEKGGEAYRVHYQAAPSNTGWAGCLYVTVLQQDEEAPIASYTAPLWLGESGWAARVEDAPLLEGNAGAHAALQSGVDFVLALRGGAETEE